MSLESENRKKLKTFFGEEYRSLKLYVKSRIRDTANRDAEDIIQDVALKLFAGADRYAPINNVAGFVYKSVKNSIIDIMRSSNASKEVETLHEVNEFGELLSITNDDQPSEEMIRILKKCVNELKPEYRFIILAIDFNGYSYKDVSHKTGIAQGTLMSRRHRAMGILQKNIKTKTVNLKK